MHLVLASDPDRLHYVPGLLLRLQLRLTRSPSKRMLLVGRKLVRDIAFGIQHPERVKPTAEGWAGIERTARRSFWTLYEEDEEPLD